MKSRLKRVVGGLGFLAALGALAAAPTGRYRIDGRTAYDTTSMLTWNRDFEPALTFAAANTYCSDLSLNGFDDWRLPTLKELQSLVDFRTGNPAIDTTVFAGTPIADPDFWSSTHTSLDSTKTWVVGFANGWAAPAGTAAKPTRCVRP
jgi:hypothetical protein